MHKTNRYCVAASVTCLIHCSRNHSFKCPARKPLFCWEVPIIWLECSFNTVHPILYLSFIMTSWWQLLIHYDIMSDIIWCLSNPCLDNSIDEMLNLRKSRWKMTWQNMTIEIRVEEQQYCTMSYEILIATNIKTSICWDVVLCSLTDRCKHFGGIYYQDINRRQWVSPKSHHFVIWRFHTSFNFVTATCSIISGYHYFAEKYCFHLHNQTSTNFSEHTASIFWVEVLQIFGTLKAVWSSKTLLPPYETTWCHTP